MIKLKAFWETGTEGVHWCLYDTTKLGYDALINLNEGDYIQIKDTWSGCIIYDTESYKQWYYWARPYAAAGDWKGLCNHFDHVWPEDWTLNDYKENAEQCFKQQMAGNMWCHWLQAGVHPDLWAQWFKDGLEVVTYVPL